jgi:glycyl-tRNA synthetase beta chain
MSTPQGNQYLLEIGTEELPVEFLKSAPTELIDKIKAALDEQAVGYGEVAVYATPRRLALVIKDLPELQAERTFKTKGPPVRVALDAEGKPTQAGLGFARKVNVDFSQLVQETIEGETYMVLNQLMAGRSTQELLADLLPAMVLGLSGSHFMAWGSNTIRFSRPIRWLVSVWNNTHLPLSIGPVCSDVLSCGHRVLGSGEIRIESVEQYLTLLEKDGSVMADQTRRREVIWKQLQDAAVKAGGTVAENEGLLDTVTMLVEHPSVVVGRFEERFLEIPEEVTVTVMQAHQKYFSVRAQNGRLLPCFMTVSNGREETADIIRHGNEKVLTARLEDARFFFTEDQKVSLEERIESLKGITFQKGLGSMFEKTQRLQTLTGQVAEALGFNASEKAHAERGARLAKADLVTGMVFEFTELQGVMGRKYAAIGGETAEVSDAIYEHYLPRFAGDDLPQSKAGVAVSLADKLDTIIAVFSQKNAKLPSGSKDPLGLRRMASGVIQTVLNEKALQIDLDALLRAAYRLLVSNLSTVETVKKDQFQDENATLALVSEFFLQRLRGMLLEQGNRYDIVDAVLEAGNPLADLRDVLARIEHLKTLTLNAEALKRIYEPGNRISRILGEQYNAGARIDEISADLFKDESENALFAQVKNLADADPERDYAKLIQALEGLGDAVERFFEKVMVNDPDDAVRKNRYNLLSVLNRFYVRLACFPKLIV